MMLGALLDLGLPLEGLRAALGSLAIGGAEIAAERVLRAGVSATKFRLTPAADDHAPAHAHSHAHAHGDPGHHHHVGDDHHHTHDHGHGDHHSLNEITAAIEGSALSRAGKGKAVRLFYRLAEAEAAIHNMPLERVHLHEVGALDSIVDIVGAVHGFEWLAADRIVCSPLNVGSGMVRCAHGRFPVPAPATARLLTGVPIYAGEVALEMVTPTGALLVTEYAESFGPLPPMRVSATGYGAGDRDIAGYPNVLRAMVGEADAPSVDERIVVLECEIDDMNPQLFGPLMDGLQRVGALDVFYAPVQMKKNRPGTLVTVVAAPERREALTALLFAETTTIGVRYHEMLRDRLEREVKTIQTPAGPIRVKIASRAGRVLNASPEFDDCARAAAERGIPIKDVQAMAMKAWLESGGC